MRKSSDYGILDTDNRSTKLETPVLKLLKLKHHLENINPAQG